MQNAEQFCYRRRAISNLKSDNPRGADYHFLGFAGGFQRGDAVHLWHTTLLARCSVLYLLARLAGKPCVMGTHIQFLRQESGQIFANENEQKSVRF